MARGFLYFYSKQRSKKILNIAIPSGLNSLLDIINLSIDLIMLGSFGATAIVGVGVSLSYMMIIFAFTTIVFVGNNALVSRFLGAKQQLEANNTITSITLATAIISIPLTCLAFLCYTPFFAWIGVDEFSQQIGDNFLQILLFGIPLLLIKQVVISAFSAAGATKIPFFIKIIITLINPFLKYCLIFGFFIIPGLEIEGAAIASLIINVIETCSLFFVLWLYKKSPVTFGKTIKLEYIKKAFKIGIPSGFERLLTIFSIILMNKFIALYGTHTLAGYQIATRIEGFAFMPGFGFMIAAMALMGQNLGAKKPLEARYSTLNTILLGSIFMGIIGLCMTCFAYYLSAIFTDEIESIQGSMSYLIPIGISQVPFAFICILDGALRGAGITKITLIVNSLMIWGLRILPCYFLAALKYPVIYIYICITLETFLRAFVYWKIFQSGIWKRHKL